MRPEKCGEASIPNFWKMCAVKFDLMNLLRIFVAWPFGVVVAPQRTGR